MPSTLKKKQRSIVCTEMNIAVLCSGGVDSSLSLALLKDKGFLVKAYYLKIWLEDEWDLAKGNCPWQIDIDYLQKTCELLDVEYEIISLQKEYQKYILEYILQEAKKGRTPNPDVLCNLRIKFGVFLEELKRKKYAFDKVATGHYASIREEGNLFCLQKGKDPIKDQSYFLAHLKQKQLSYAYFPLDAYHKSEVRALSKKFSLPASQRKDSQGLCFLGKISYRDFLKRYLGTKKGKLLELESKKELGEHDGYWFYTIGQRQGLRLSGGPWYVVQKDIKKNIIYISRSYENLDKNRDRFLAQNIHWISGFSPWAQTQNKSKMKLHVKLRHGPDSYPCKIKEYSSQKIEVFLLDGKDQGIAPGQFAVFYDRNMCLGCATIS